MSRISAKTTFEAARILRPIYTGGSTSLDASGRVLVTCVGEDALVIDLTTGNQLASLEGDGELITSLAITPSASHAVVCSRSMSMRFYSLTPLSSNNKEHLEPSLLRTVKAHTSPVVTTAVDPTGTLLATGGADGSIKVWDIRGGFITHTFHGHGGVVTALNFFECLEDVVESKGAKGDRKRHNETETEKSRTIRLASGDEEGKIRIWDLYKKKSIASLELHVSVVRNLYFAPEQNALLSASRDKTLIVWDVRTWKSRRIIPCLESLESAGCISDSALCFTGGERGVLRVWDMNRGGEITQQQEAGSETDAIITAHYSPNLPFVVTVHADQTIRIHSLESLTEYSPGSSLAPLPVIRRISGNDDEVIDLAYVGPERSMLAMATNTESIRIVSITAPDNGASSNETSDSYFGADVTYLDGHDDIIICLDVDWSGYWLATGAKDNSARLWRLDPETSSYTCAAILTGHAESLGAIALPRAPPPVGSKAYTDPLNHPPAFLFTGSQDRTIKKWDTSKIGTSQPVRASYTRKAHEKDINSLDVNHTATLLASASQDRTVKIWSAEDGSVVGILRGHKRGVWSVRFSPRDMPIITLTAGASTTRGLVATGSGDKTVKIWNLADFSCLLTFEGHTNSVLKVIWLPPSQFPSEDENGDESTNQDRTASRPLLASSAADGLVKIWSPYTGELETILDNHTDRVWALASPTPSGSRADVKVPSTSPYALISGAADSTVTFWKDTTSATLTAAVSANSARIEQDQQLQNYIRTGAYREAITLALQLNHPARLLSLFTAAIEESDGNRSGEAKDKNDADEMALSGNSSVDAVLQSLDKDNLYLLLLRLRDWNTNTRTAKVAQRILYTLVRSYPASTFIELANRPPPATASQGKRSQKNNSGLSLKEVFSALTSYTDRHYRRVEELVDESYLIEWVLDEMEGGMGLVSGFSQKETKDAPPNREEDVLMLEV